jgi:hypothetical protein
MTAIINTLNVPLVAGQTFSFEMSLFKQTDTKKIKTTVTYAVGDAKVYRDGVLVGNLSTPPSEIGGNSGVLTVTLTIAETTGTNRGIYIAFIDVADAEWCDCGVYIPVSVARNVGTSDLTAGAQMDLINDAVDAASLAASAVAEIQSGLSTLTAADVWGYATRTLTSFGSLVSDIWSNVSRTLTQAIASAIAALSGDSLAITVSDTWSQTLTGLRESTSYVSIDLVVKKQKKDDDEDAVIWIRKNASGSGDGLLYLNGATPVSPVVAGDGSITVVSSTSLTFNLAARATAELIGNVDLNGLFYAVKYYFASEAATVQTGVCNVDEGVIRAIE